MNLRPRNRVNPSFNMSSMTDLVFLLLIFFMILTTLIKTNTVLNLNLPSSTSKEKSKARVRVNIDASYQMYLDRTPVTPETLGPLLRQRLGDNPEARVEVAVDENVPHKFFVQVADIVSVQNGYRMLLVTKPPSAR
ncbi:MAG: biopolymer transporter ExbD [Flavobacteriales bacterium]|nr:biopolymer transporter ExbD [Flavobacteriales bacterium]MCX7767928.1 biopolymer transporter ExbD [Flavobacteriales bacterium]MDW8409332.1 biopolymer transporter ExbD [Flavobacteriales bacterium]